MDGLKDEVGASNPISDEISSEPKDVEISDAPVLNVSSEEETIKESEGNSEPANDPSTKEMEITEEAIKKTALIEAEVRKTEHHKRVMTTLIAAFIVLALLVVIGFQTIYIYKLSTGRHGIMTYDNVSYREDEESDSKDDKRDDKDIEAQRREVVDPLFDLEEASSVTDPNKKTLKTWEIAEKVMPATASIFIVQNTNGNEVTLSAGSGFIISEDGYVVTNKHVIDDAITNKDLTIAVRIPGANEAYTAKIVGSDGQTDIAVIKLIDAENLPTVTLGDSDTLQIGELAIAIGNPLGTFESTVTVGVISANSREMNFSGYPIALLQTDASINSGNSGGPLINSFGEVIGVTNAKITSAEGLGFAIPINTIKGVIESIINVGYVANRPTLGVSIQTVVESSYFGANAGFYVSELVSGGPAEQAGLEIGDRILKFDGVEITSTNDIISIRDSHNVGDEVIVEVERDGKNIKLTLVIGESADYED